MKGGNTSRTISLLRGWGVLAAVAVGVLAAVNQLIIGIFEVSLGWAVGRALVLAIIAYFVAHAIEADDPGVENRWLRATVASLVVLVAGIGVYNFTRNDDQEPSSYEFIVDVESEIQMLRPSAEPGGPQLIFLPALEGLQSYRFICEVALSDGSVWFRRDGEPTAFVPKAFLRRPNGLEPVTLPVC